MGSLKKPNQREVVQKLRKGEQSYETRCLDLIHITLTFGQNILYGCLVMARKRNVYTGCIKRKSHFFGAM